MADQLLLEKIDADPTKCLPIDDENRTIRFYGDLATIVMTDDAVCELSFKPDLEDRNVIIDDTIVIPTRVNQDYKTFEVDGERHQLKIGAPTRELWIDGDWVECYFNNSVGVKIGSKLHQVFLAGQLPEVKVGEPRPDLCLGRIYALLDGNMNGRMPIYLDRKPQRIDIAGKPHVIQFVEGFKTLTINGHPFRSDFGGFPMVISVQGKKHYLRLTALPPTINLDHLPPRVQSPLSPNNVPKIKVEDSPNNKRSTSPNFDTDRATSPYSPQDESSQDAVGLGKNDPLNSLMTLFPAASDNVPTTPGSSYNTNPPPVSLSSLPPAPPAPIPPPASVPNDPPKDVNVNNIFDSLLKFDWSGFGIPGLMQTETREPKVEVKPPPELIPEPVIDKTPKLKAPSAPIKMIVLVSHHPTLKERQDSIIEQLYRADDLQCKSCGVRFSKEEMPQYTSHLDWHFR